MRSEVLICQKESCVLEELYEDWCEEAVDHGFGPCESIGRTRRWHCAHRTAEVEEAGGGSKKESVSLSLFMEITNLEVEEYLTTMATLFWAEGVCLGRLRREQQKPWRKQIFEVQTWRQVRGPVMCETRGLGIKWPQWHIFRF